MAQKTLHELELEVARLKRDAFWILVIGALLLSFLSYTSFYQIPKDIKQSLAGQAARQIMITLTNAQAEANAITKIHDSLNNNLVRLNRAISVERDGTISVRFPRANGRFQIESAGVFWYEQPEGGNESHLIYTNSALR